MTAAPSDPLSDLGRLANNGMAVQSLQSALSQGEMNVNLIPKLIKRVATKGAWLEFLFSDSPTVVHRHNAAEFRKFIEEPRPNGCQTPLHVLERMLRGTDAWKMYLELTRGEQGGDNNPYGRAGKPTPEINRDNITVDSDAPATIPLSPDVPRPRKRDYEREAPTGTSVSYTLRFLSKKAPELYARVKAGELTANKAMVLGGFRVKQITLPAEPDAAARVLRRHFHGDDLARLIQRLQDEDHSH